MNGHVTAADGVKIAFETAGFEPANAAPPVVLVHGFGANRRITWANTHWYRTLTVAGHRIVAIDCRGHGQSDKPYDPIAYDEGRMAADIVAVLDGLEIKEADLMGYSMGGYLAIRLLRDAPERLRRVVLGGVGAAYFKRTMARDEIIAQAMEAADPAAIADVSARDFRVFCERAGDDLKAMAACLRRPRRLATPEELARITQPVLVVCGSEDHISGPPGPLAECFPNGAAETLPGRNHHSAVGDRTYKEAAIAFFGREEPA